jgi:hypothetical protein
LRLIEAEHISRDAGNCFKFAQIRPDFVNYELGFAITRALTTGAGPGVTLGKGEPQFAVSLGRRFRHHSLARLNRMRAL